MLHWCSTSNWARTRPRLRYSGLVPTSSGRPTFNVFSIVLPRLRDVVHGGNDSARSGVLYHDEVAGFESWVSSADQVLGPHGDRIIRIGCVFLAVYVAVEASKFFGVRGGGTPHYQAVSEVFQDQLLEERILGKSFSFSYSRFSHFLGALWYKVAFAHVSGPASIFHNKPRLHGQQRAALVAGGPLSREGREVLLAIYWEVSAS